MFLLGLQVMTEQDLQDLKARCQYAVAHGFGIAKSHEIAAELVEEGASKPSMKVPAAKDLLEMIEQVEASFAGETAPAAPAKKAASVKPPPLPVAPPPPAPVAVPVVDTKDSTPEGSETETVVPEGDDTVS